MPTPVTRNTPNIEATPPSAWSRTWVYRIRILEAQRGRNAFEAQAGGSTNKPSIQNLTPAPGSVLFTDTPITFDVIDPDDDLASIILIAEYKDYSEIVCADSVLGWDFNEASTIEKIDNGWRFAIRRNGGWKAAPTIAIHVLDRRGNEAEPWPPDSPTP